MRKFIFAASVLALSLLLVLSSCKTNVVITESDESRTEFSFEESKEDNASLQNGSAEPSDEVLTDSEEESKFISDIGTDTEQSNSSEGYEEYPESSAADETGVGESSDESIFEEFGDASQPTDITNSESTEPETSSGEDISSAEPKEDENASFSIVTSDGKFSYSKANAAYTITAAGTYDCCGELNEGRIIVSAGESDKIIINLNGCTITNSTADPISLLTADEVDISAKKGTENKVCDLRSASSGEDASGAAIYAECDLTLKGNGSLEVISNYNNGIHTKDDLKIKNLTLYVKAVNNAVKGNDSVKIESGTVTAISTGGDALKTTSTDLNKNGAQRGSVEISGGTVKLYAACDGIDSATDVAISGSAALSVYTDSYSPYSGDVMASSNSTIYLRVNSSVYKAGYKYSAYFYNSDGSYKWVNASFYKSSSASTAPGGMGGNSKNTYYYYAIQKPSGYTNVLFYAYSSSQSQGQSQSYTAVSQSDTTLPSSRDTYAVSSISGGTISGTGWTNYQTTQGNTGVDYSCKGIKSGNTVTVSGGTVVIKSKDDAIHANFDEALESTGKNGLGNITITGGKITVTCFDDGIHADQDLIIKGGTVNVVNSYEGLEANRIYISGGSVTVYATDDGLNANSKGAYAAYIEISGGETDVTVPSGDTDTLDSNGTILISGGFVFIKNGQTNGSSMTGGTIDCDRGVTVTGGTVISVGCICGKIANSSYSTSQTLSAGSYTVKNSSGAELASFELSSSYKAYMFWSESFASGQTYTVYKDGSVLFSFKK